MRTRVRSGSARRWPAAATSGRGSWAARGWRRTARTPSATTETGRTRRMTKVTTRRVTTMTTPPPMRRRGRR
uniref:Uncharacterized protein n=1 Tax=Arundo donax TaxID=35708 RepID=A0A0A9G7Z5_ARUDO